MLTDSNSLLSTGRDGKIVLWDYVKDVRQNIPLMPNQWVGLIFFIFFHFRFHFRIVLKLKSEGK